MNFNQALVIVSKPTPEPGFPNDQWLTFLHKSKDLLSSTTSARKIGETSFLLSLDLDGKNFLRAISDLKIPYKLFLVWEMTEDLIRSFDEFYCNPECV